MIFADEPTFVETAFAHGFVPDEPTPDVTPDSFVLGLALDEAQESAASDPLLRAHVSDMGWTSATLGL